MQLGAFVLSLPYFEISTPDHAGGTMDQLRVCEKKRCFSHEPQSRQPENARIRRAPAGHAGGQNRFPVRSECLVVERASFRDGANPFRKPPATNLEQCDTILEN